MERVSIKIPDVNLSYVEHNGGKDAILTISLEGSSAVLSTVMRGDEKEPTKDIVMKWQKVKRKYDWIHVKEKS